jgi:peptide/nickel transport system permease protein
MRRFLLRRLGAAAVTIVLASMVVFGAVRALPGSVAVALSGENGSPSALAAISKQFGLDKPLPVQYLDWVGQVVRGNFGTSATTGMPASTELANRIPVTLELAVLSILLGAAIGLPAGIIAALRRGTRLDYASNGVALFGLSIPSFWFGILLVLLLSIRVHLLPSSGYVSLFSNPVSNLEHMAMPVFVLGTGLSAVLMRQMRSGMLETLRSDYIRTARSKGLPERIVIGKHALRNSVTAVVTVLGLQFGALLSGVAVIEEVFLLPGVGQLTIDSVFQRDYPVIEAVALLTAVTYVVINVGIDIAYSFLNPKVRLTGAAG